MGRKDNWRNPSLALFGLEESPFSTAPDPRFLYPTWGHREALANLRYGVEDRKGFIVLTGEVGCGKTTLLSALKESLLEKGHIVAHAQAAALSSTDLLTLIVRDISGDDGAGSGSPVSRLLQEIEAAAREAGRRERSLVIILDEAQGMTREAFEALRLLSNIETRDGKLCQVVLAGQPELIDTLGRRAFRQISSRVAVWTHLSEIKRREVARYIEHRLSVAGHKGNAVFTADAIALIGRVSRGVPRLINIICDRAMLIAAMGGFRIVTARMADEAAIELRLKRSWWPRLRWERADLAEMSSDETIEEPRRFLTLPRLALSAIACLLFILLPWSLVARGSGDDPDSSSRRSFLLQRLANESSLEGGISEDLVMRILDESGFRGPGSDAPSPVGFTTTIDALSSIGLPAIIGTNHGPLGILSYEPGELLVTNGIEEVRADPGRLGEIFTGRATVFVTRRYGVPPLSGGADIIRFQTDLSRLLGRRLHASGGMDGPTRNALTEYQERKGITADGIFGPETEAALFADLGAG